MALPEGALRSLAGPAENVSGKVLDYRAQLLKRLDQTIHGEFDLSSVAGARRQSDQRMAVALGDNASVESLGNYFLKIPEGEYGSERTLTARVYRPTGQKQTAKPAIIYFHQGGFVIGGPDWCEPFCTLLSHRLDAVVLNVDYRLAPEHPFPAPLQDALASHQWLLENADKLGVDTSRIAMGGDSAGGTLAATTVIEMKARGLPLPKAQLLIYPLTDLLADTPSRKEHAQGHPLNETFVNWAMEKYLPYGTDYRDPRVSPAYADDLSGLPSAVVVAAGFDLLCDEAIEYAAQLKRAQVTTELLHYPALPHGFTGYTGVLPGAELALGEIAEKLKEIL